MNHDTAEGAPATTPMGETTEKQGEFRDDEFWEVQNSMKSVPETKMTELIMRKSY